MSQKIKFHKNLDIQNWLNRDIFYVMGNIGSEVNRSIKWKEKGKEDKWIPAFYRSLELFDLSINNRTITNAQLSELMRAREVWVDFIYGDNEYQSTSKDIRKYFDQFVFAYQNYERERKSLHN